MSHRCRRTLVESLEHRVLFATLPAGFLQDLVGGSISNGTNMFFAPDGRLFVTQQTGQLRVIDHGVLQATPFTTVPTYTTVTGERGLLGIAFDPNYFDNHYVYVYYTALTPAAHNRVSRFTADPNNPDVAVAGSEVVLLDLNNLSTATNHNGGSIHFGGDGKLYVSVGENANGANAQSFGNLLGKILRMNVTPGNIIPTDNPYYNDATVTGNNKLIWSLGLRNPYTFAFQNGTGRMFINDVGESTWEEINDGLPHKNYGWPTIEGVRTTQTPPADYMNPLFVYDHSNSQTAIIGGAFYNPTYASYPASYVGKYFFSDLGAGWIHTVDVSGPSPVVGNFATGVSTPSSIQLGPDGSIYFLQRGGTQGAYRARNTDTTAPTVSNPTFVYDEPKPNFGTGMRFRVSFSEYVGDSLTPADLTLVNTTTGQTVPTANITLQYDAATNIATFSFPNIDGRYHATLAAGSGVTDITGNALASGVSFDLFILSGDANHDGAVDTLDFNALAGNFGGTNKTYSQGDFNYDGVVDTLDFNTLAAQFGKTAPPAALAAADAAAAPNSTLFSKAVIRPESEPLTSLVDLLNI